MQRFEERPGRLSGCCTLVGHDLRANRRGHPLVTSADLKTALDRPIPLEQRSFFEREGWLVPRPQRLPSRPMPQKEPHLSGMIGLFYPCSQKLLFTVWLPLRIISFSFDICSHAYCVCSRSPCICRGDGSDSF